MTSRHTGKLKCNMNVEVRQYDYKNSLPLLPGLSACFFVFSVQVPQQAVPFDGPVFFGGVPDMKLLATTSAIGTNFIGCIGDATLNGKIVNFAQSQNQLNAVLQKCPLQKSTSLFVKPSIGRKELKTSVC